MCLKCKIFDSASGLPSLHWLNDPLVSYRMISHIKKQIHQRNRRKGRMIAIQRNTNLKECGIYDILYKQLNEADISRRALL